MKRFPLVAVLFLGGLLLMGADGCASDPNVEGAKLDLRNKDYDRALENVNTALESNPDNAEALELKGRILQEQLATVEDPARHTELVQEMVDSYERAVELDPSLSEDVTQRLRLAYFNEFQRGGQAFNRGRDDSAAYAEAAQYFENASLIQPDSAGAYVNRGYALYNAGELEAAMAPLEAAIELGDAEAETYFFLSTLYAQNERYEDVIELLEGARTLFPENTDIQDQILNAYIASGRVDEALAQYQASVDRAPDNKIYRYNYGTLLLQAERYEEAAEQFAEAVAIDPAYGIAHYNLGAAYVNKAFDINEEIGTKDDALRAERNDLTDAQIQAREAELEELAAERRALYEQAISPLERARELMSDAEQAQVESVCRALFQAYVQTDQEDKARDAAECAGIDLD